MFISKKLIWISFLILFSFFLSGCSVELDRAASYSPTPGARVYPTFTPYVFKTYTPNPTKTPLPSQTPTPTLPALPGFTGRLLLMTGLSELRWLNVEGKNASLEEPFVAQLQVAAVSPDWQWALFSGWKNNITLLNLQNGEQQQIIPQRSTCFSWSPGSTRFSYKVIGTSPALYAYEVATGKSEKIVDFLCANYMGFGLEGKSNELGEGMICGEVTCGAWLDDSHLLFQRFSGEMPEKITRVLSGTYPELRSQHTNLAVLDDNLNLTALEETPGRWYELESCAFGPYVLMHTSLDDNLIYISPTFRDFSEIQPRPIPERERFEGVPRFADPQCNILYRHQSALYHERWITLINPQTLEVVLESAYLPTKYTQPDGKKVIADWSWDGVWVGDPQDRTMAIARTESGGKAIIFFDLVTGAYSLISTLDEVNVDVLAWVSP
jgi:hypothetical protein